MVASFVNLGNNLPINLIYVNIAALANTNTRIQPQAWIVRFVPPVLSIMTPKLCVQLVYMGNTKKEMTYLVRCVNTAWLVQCTRIGLHCVPHVLRANFKMKTVHRIPMQMELKLTLQIVLFAVLALHLRIRPRFAVHVLVEGTNRPTHKLRPHALVVIRVNMLLIKKPPCVSVAQLDCFRKRSMQHCIDARNVLAATKLIQRLQIVPNVRRGSIKIISMLMGSLKQNSIKYK